jgi:ADP-ribose pyrophosphatase YjhB (NUDIX family)
MASFPHSKPPVSAAAVFLARPDRRGLLFIRRAKEPFRGLWGLPGGKIRSGEHPLDAARREIFEETGLKPRMLSLRAVVSEIFYRKNKPAFHTMLFLVSGTAAGAEFKSSDEGALAFFNLDEITTRRREIIPSDFQFIRKIYLPKKTGFFKVDIAADGGYRLLRFAHEK